MYLASDVLRRLPMRAQGVNEGGRVARHRGSADGYCRSRARVRPVPVGAATGLRRAGHSPWALQAVVVAALALGAVVGLAVPFEDVAGATPAVSGPWLPCTNASLSSGTCVPGYGSAIYNGKDGYYGLPAALAGPTQLYLSRVFCPAGSPAAKAAESCSAPFQLTLSKVTLTPAIGVIGVENFGFESPSGTNAGGAVAVLDNPLAIPGTDPGAAWCVTVPTNANPEGETCVAESNTSLPVYLAASSPPVLGTVLMCVGGQVAPHQNAFEACLQAAASTKPFSTNKAKSSTISTGTTVKKQSSPVHVTLSAPTLSHSSLAVGASAAITVTVTSSTGSLNEVTLGAAPAPSSSSLLTTTKPQVALPTLVNGVASAFNFTFSVKGLRAGKATIDVSAVAQLATGATAIGTAHIAVTVG
jgi:hypothetical protein